MKKWQILYKPKAGEEITQPAILQILFRNRGLADEKDIQNFLHSKPEDVSLTSTGINKEAVKKTVKRIDEALKKKEKIIIYGDYDVDGITASAILWETLFSLKAAVTPYIPHRIEEGYGLSIKGIEHVRQQFPDVTLIITVDNGIVANDAADYAKEKGIDVIITDHHTLGPVLPDAYAIVHTTKLCGAGVAYMLTAEIKKKYGITADDGHLELAALGTIADLVPLMGANRAIVKSGLRQIAHTKRVGLQELFREAGCDSKSIGVYEVGHIIAPRLNATGRMSSAMDSLRLLCTKDTSRAIELASHLGTTNKERQTVMADAAKHASLSVNARQELKKLLIVSHDEYPEGVIGLVAGRLVEEFYRPSIVIARGEKISKGSVRSIEGFNIIDFLRQSSEYFLNIGGHPMAAGFTIETDKIEKMTEALEKFAHEALDESLFIRTLKIDCEIPLYTVTNNFYSIIQQLSPFGMGNPEPVFASRKVIIEDLRPIGKENKHLRLTVSQENAEMNAVAFGFGEMANELHIGDAVDIAYTINENSWNGRTSLQLKIKDLQRQQ